MSRVGSLPELARAFATIVLFVTLGGCSSGSPDELSANGAPALERALESMNNAADKLGLLAERLTANPSQLLHGRRTPPGPGEE